MYYPDFWIKRSTTDNGTAYYKYMLVYVNYVIHLTKNAKEDIFKLHQVCRLKEGFGPPYKYIGANIDKVRL